MAQSRGDAKAPKLGALPTDSGQSRIGARAADDNAPWKPDHANSTAWEFSGGIATVRHDLVWTGSTSYPLLHPDHGMEIGDKQINDSIIPGPRPGCVDPRADSAFWAKRVDDDDPISWTIIIPGNSAGDFKPYWDWENATDSCKEMELAIGIGRPHTFQASGVFRIFTEVTTPRGANSISEAASDIQSPGNDCPIGVDPASWCMGLDTSRGQGAVTLLRPNTGKTFPGSWHWNGATGIADWENAKCTTYGNIRTAYNRVRASVGSCEVWEYPSDNGGRGQNFSQGRIYWHPNTGAYGIWGKIGEAYALAGATAGPLKYPKSDEIKCPTKACWFNRFETGNIYWSAATGAHAVYGAIFAAYGRNGYENGRFGLPTSDEFAVNGGRQVNFQGGWIRWLSATNSIVTS